MILTVVICRSHSAPGNQSPRRTERRSYAIPHLSEIGNREKFPVTGKPGAIGLQHLKQTLGLGQRERPKQQGVRDAKNRGIGPDAQTERYHHGSGESRHTPQIAQSILQIAPDPCEPGGAPLIAAFLPKLGGAPERLHGGPPGIGRAHTGFLIPFDFKVDVIAKLLIQVSVETALLKSVRRRNFSMVNSRISHRLYHQPDRGRQAFPLL